MVRELATGDDRVDLIKVVQDRGGPNRALQPITQSVLDAIVAEAHANGLMVAAHWGTFTDLQELLHAGVDELEHVDSRDLLGGWPGELLKDLVERKVPIAATLTISEAALPPDVMPEGHADAATARQRVSRRQRPDCCRQRRCSSRSALRGRCPSWARAACRERPGSTAGVAGGHSRCGPGAGDGTV